MTLLFFNDRLLLASTMIYSRELLNNYLIKIIIIITCTYQPRLVWFIDMKSIIHVCDAMLFITTSRGSHSTFNSCERTWFHFSYYSRHYQMKERLDISKFATTYNFTFIGDALSMSTLSLIDLRISLSPLHIYTTRNMKGRKIQLQAIINIRIKYFTVCHIDTT